MKRFIFLLVVAVAVVGCGKAKPSAVVPKVADENEIAQKQEDANSKEDTWTEMETSEERLVEEVVIVDRVQLKQDAKPDSEPEPAEKAIPKTARAMLLSDEGPLLIDLHVTRDGESALARFDQTVKKIMAIASGEGDAELTWETLMNHPRFQRGEFGNPPAGNYDQQANAIRQYDTTRNGRVDLNEILSYITKNQSSQAMSLITSNDRRNKSRDASPIRLLLDQNDNRQLDPDELLAASERLRTRDSDDDDILTPDEFIDAVARNDPMSQPRRRYRNLDPNTGWLLELDGRQRWSNVRIAWETLYAGGQSVEPQDIGDRLFSELDLDEDGRIDNTEMEMLIEIEPDLALHVELASQPPEVSLLASRLPKESIQALLQHQPNRITLRLPNTTLDLFANKTSNNAARNQAANLFQSADENKNGSLSLSEFETANLTVELPFTSIDLDGDEAVTLTELEESLQQRTVVVDSQLRIRADHHDDAIFCVLDQNADGRLDGREIEAAPSILQTLDRNGDSVVQSREIGNALVLGVVLGGSVAPLDPLLAVPSVRRQTLETVPDWFAGMDRNDDQSISWREFLGTRKQFVDLDTDSDGFVDTVEAVTTRG